MDKRDLAAGVMLRLADYIERYGLKDRRLSEALDDIKTQAYYERALQTAVREFYRLDIGVGEFIDEMVRLIEGQLRRAWNEGMRQNGFDPREDARPEWEAILQDEINSEIDHILDFAQAIEDARQAEPYDPDGFRAFYYRVTLWANRYKDIVSLALITTEPHLHYKWVLGIAEHCQTCAALSETVATGLQWQASGYRPQNPPNPLLECGGWNCKCSLVKTGEPLTEGGIPMV